MKELHTKINQLAQDDKYKIVNTQLHEIIKRLGLLLDNSDLIRGMNTLTPGFITMTVAVGTQAVRLYQAVSDRPILIAHPIVAGEGTDILYIGNTGVTIVSGYPIIAGEFWNFFMQRNTDIYGISNGNAVAHILIY